MMLDLPWILLPVDPCTTPGLPTFIVRGKLGSQQFVKIVQAPDHAAAGAQVQRELRLRHPDAALEMDVQRDDAPEVA